MRYLQRNPKAKLYADFADFAFFRLAIQTVHFNGGFGRSDALSPADILASRDGEAALVGAEPRVERLGERSRRPGGCAPGRKQAFGPPDLACDRH